MKSRLDPGIFVNLTAKKLLCVNALLANDLGSLDKVRIIYDKRPPSPEITFFVS
jgi:hypothetical protein